MLSVPTHNLPIIDGDMNAQIVISDVHTFVYYAYSNRNGIFLGDFIEENNLTTKFQKSCRQMYKDLIGSHPDEQEVEEQ